MSRSSDSLSAYRTLQLIYTHDPSLTISNSISIRLNFDILIHQYGANLAPRWLSKQVLKSKLLTVCIHLSIAVLVLHITGLHIAIIFSFIPVRKSSCLALRLSYGLGSSSDTRLIKFYRTCSVELLINTEDCKTGGGWCL